MDFFDLLIFLVIFLAPALSRLFGKKNQKNPPQGVPSELAPSEQNEDSLGEALRQIREALGEPAQPEKPRPLPEAPRPVVARQIGEFHSLGEFEHEAHGFGRENPLSEEVFEQRPAFQTHGTTERIRRKGLGDVDLSTPLEVKTLTTSSRPNFTRLLRTPKRAREAFVLREILDAPRSRRRLR